MPKTLDGQLSGKGLKIALVAPAGVRRRRVAGTTRRRKK